MANTTFKGPVISTNGFVGAVTGNVTGAVTGTTVSASTSLTVGAGTAITKILKGTVSLTVSALAAAAEEDVDAAVTNATAGDIVIITPLEATAETGLTWTAWVLSSGNITARFGNTSGSSLTGSTSNWQYCLIRS